MLLIFLSLFPPTPSDAFTVAYHSTALVCMYIYTRYDNNLFRPRGKWMIFLLAQVAKLVAHARFLKSTILIQIGDMFVKWILKGRK